MKCRPPHTCSNCVSRGKCPLTRPEELFPDDPTAPVGKRVWTIRVR